MIISDALMTKLGLLLLQLVVLFGLSGQFDGGLEGRGHTAVGFGPGGYAGVRMELPRYVILRIEDHLTFLIAGGLGCPFAFLLGF